MGVERLTLCSRCGTHKLECTVGRAQLRLRAERLAWSLMMPHVSGTALLYSRAKA